MICDNIFISDLEGMSLVVSRIKQKLCFTQTFNYKNHDMKMYGKEIFLKWSLNSFHHYVYLIYQFHFYKVVYKTSDNKIKTRIFVYRKFHMLLFGI